MPVVGFATTMRSLRTFAGGGRIGDAILTGAPVLDGIPLLVEMRLEYFHTGMIGKCDNWAWKRKIRFLSK
jgi:hypothetical protein